MGFITVVVNYYQWVVAMKATSSYPTPVRQSDSGESERLPCRSRYDLHLALIPFLFVSGGLSSLTLGISYFVTFAIASLIAIFAMVDCLYFNPPTDMDGPPNR